MARESINNRRRRSKELLSSGFVPNKKSYLRQLTASAYVANNERVKTSSDGRRHIVMMVNG